MTADLDNDHGNRTGSPLPMTDGEREALAAICWEEMKSRPELRFCLQRLSVHEIRHIIKALTSAMIIWLDHKAPRVQAAIAELRTARAALEVTDDTAWLVEVVGQPSGWRPAYYVGGAGKRVQFSTGDADKAMRFARKEDAAAAIASLNLIGCEPREHMWLPALTVAITPTKEK